MWCKGFASFLPRQPVKAYFAREPTPNVDWGWVRTNCAHVDRAACEFAEALVPLLRILHGKMATADLDRVRLQLSAQTPTEPLRVDPPAAIAPAARYRAEAPKQATSPIRSRWGVQRGQLCLFSMSR